MWRTHLENSPDESGLPVTGLGLTFTTERAFDIYGWEKLTKMGPPAYGWSFSDILEGDQASAEAGFVWGRNRFPMTPGFDASRLFDKTEFSVPDTQTLTITVTPREEKTGKPHIAVHTYTPDSESLVDAVIISPTSGEHVKLSPDGHDLYIDEIPMELNTPWTITVTIRVTPKVPEVEFVPYVWVGWRETLIDSDL